MRYNDYEVTYDKGGEFSSGLIEQWLLYVQDIQNPCFIHNIHWFRVYLNSHAEDATTHQIYRLHYQNQIIAVFLLQCIINKQYDPEFRILCLFWLNNMGINGLALCEPGNSHNCIKLFSYLLFSNQSFLWVMLEMQDTQENRLVENALKNYLLSRTVSLMPGWSKYLACGITYDKSLTNLSPKLIKIIIAKPKAG